MSDFEMLRNLGEKVVELEKKYEKLFKTVHGISPDDVDNLKQLVLDNHRTVIGYCDELKKKVNTQAEKIKGFQFTVNRFLKKNLERIEKLEKDAKDHDLYQQDQYDIIKQELSELKASSASHTVDRKAQNKQIEYWGKEVEELKEKQIHWATLENVTVCRLGIEDLEEVLRDMLENKKKNAEQHIAELVNEPEIEERFITACRKQIEDAKRQLKKLGGGKELPKRENDLNHTHGINSETSVSDSKPPSCEFCGRDLIYYEEKWICGHGCIKPAVNPSEQDIAGSARQTEKNDDIWAFECPICGFLASNIPVKKVDFTKPWSVKVLVKKEELEWWCRDTRGPIHDSMKKYLEEDKE